MNTDLLTWSPWATTTSTRPHQQRTHMINTRDGFNGFARLAGIAKVDGSSRKFWQIARTVFLQTGCPSWSFFVTYFDSVSFTILYRLLYPSIVISDRWEC